MSTIPQQIEAAVIRALGTLVGEQAAQMDPLVRPTQEPRFGDYQSNVALRLGKTLGRNSREIAESLAAAVEIAPVCDPPEIAGPGFLNFRIRPDYLAQQLCERQADERLGIPRTSQPRRVVIDYSSPNLAKEMHVGHLRSTIIGESIARLLAFEGHDVLCLNHVGDWGTQFGMLIQYVRESNPEVVEQPEQFHVGDLEAFYKQAKQRFDSDQAFAEAARRSVVDLQAGEETAQKLWQAFCRESLRHCHAIYDRLGVSLVDRGESFYNPMLAQVVEDLLSSGLAVEEQGAVCVFLDGWTNREGQPQPMIVRKSDGGYNYETTDLAAIRHRVAIERADRLLYVVDMRQHQHFEMLFAVARKAGWVSERVSLEHVGFGMVLGPDRRPFKTREGGTIKLKELLDEAEARAARILSQDETRRPDLDSDQRAQIARAVGLGAVKYADLGHNLSSDYLFDWDTMLAMEGNTAPYMLYAYARIRSIARRAGSDMDALPGDLRLEIEHPSEIALAKQLLNFEPILQQVTASLRPHLLTEYLYGLSRAFTTFYDRETGVRVLDAQPDSLQQSRLRLCDLTARTLRLGLGLLGIEVVERM